MKSIEQKCCSSCGNSFACGAERGEKSCWCDDLPHVSLVANADQDCSCPQCLREAIQKMSRANTPSRTGVEPAIKATMNSQYSLVEGEDYYSEDKAIVFTARYHLRRGYCCENA